MSLIYFLHLFVPECVIREKNVREEVWDVQVLECEAMRLNVSLSQSKKCHREEVECEADPHLQFQHLAHLHWLSVQSWRRF